MAYYPTSRYDVIITRGSGPAPRPSFLGSYPSKEQARAVMAFYVKDWRQEGAQTAVRHSDDHYELLRLGQHNHKIEVIG